MKIKWPHLFHRWKYYRETHVITGMPGGRNCLTMTIDMRECKICGRREHHMMPKRNGRRNNWKLAKFGPNDVINMKQIK